MASETKRAANGGTRNAAIDPARLDTIERVLNATQKEARRRDELLARTAADQEAEQRRREARARVAAGDPASLADAALPPTPEWLAKAPTMEVTAARGHWTDQAVKTQRRVLSQPRINEMHAAGVLDDRQFAACRFYLSKWTLAGMAPAPSIAAYNADPRGEAVWGHLGRSPAQAQCRSDIRIIQGRLEPLALRVFELVVIADFSLNAIARELRTRPGTARARFIDAVDKVVLIIDVFLQARFAERGRRGQAEKDA